MPYSIKSGRSSNDHKDNKLLLPVYYAHGRFDVRRESPFMRLPEHHHINHHMRSPVDEKDNESMTSTIRSRTDSEVSLTMFLPDYVRPDEKAKVSSPKSHVRASSTVIPLLIAKEATLPPLPAKPAALPAPTVDRMERFFIWFNLYRKLFFLTFTLNFIALIFVTQKKFGYAEKNVFSFALGNLLASVLARNELFLRIAYWLAVKIFSWTPIRIKNWVTSFFVHLGGIHSGCSSAGLMWACYSAYRAFQQRSQMPASILVFAVLTPITLGASISVAVPWIRHHHHNLFEKVHRFAGWLGLVYLWVLVILLESYNPSTRAFHPSSAGLWRRQDFWYSFILTLMIIAPWLTLQKIPVIVSSPSPKTAFLSFPGGCFTGLLGRISRSPWLEWHAFGIISEGPLSFTHHMLVVAQGDWTRDLIANPPEYVWTRGLKFAGLPYLAQMYQRGVIVATGAGLGVTLSVYLQTPGYFHLIWIGADLEKTYGPEVMGLLTKAVKGDRMTLVDTRKQGRPDTVQLIDDVYRKIDAQVVFVTSNPKGTEIITQGCRARGMPCFGPLWDS